MTSFKLNVFGRIVLVRKSEQGWELFYPGEGKMRPVGNEIFVPPNVEESQVIRYIADLCHEWSSDKYPDVLLLDD